MWGNNQRRTVWCEFDYFPITASPEVFYSSNTCVYLEKHAIFLSVYCYVHVSSCYHIHCRSYNVTVVITPDPTHPRLEANRNRTINTRLLK